MDGAPDPPQINFGDDVPPSWRKKYGETYLEEDRGYMLFITAIVLIVLDTTMVSLRFCARRIQRSRLRVDDYLVLVGLVFCWGLYGSYISMF
jgi:hypothetical protein